MPRATDIMPITDFTRAYQKVIRDLKKHGRPKVLTIDGKPSVVIQGAEAYDQLLDQLNVLIELTNGLADERPPLSVGEARARISRLAKNGWKKQPARRSAGRAA